MSNKLIDLSALSDYKTRSDAKYQDKLTAGTGISIDANNVISATGGGGGATFPPAFVFNNQEPDFTATFTLNSAFSTAVANQDFSNYKLGAKLSIGGTYPGTLYLADADYDYGHTSSHHIAAVFVGSTSSTVGISTTTSAMSAVYNSLKNQIGTSHLINGIEPLGMMATTSFFCGPLGLFTDYSAQRGGVYNELSILNSRLALFKNYRNACLNMLDSAGHYSTGLALRSNASGTATMAYYYFSGNTGAIYNVANTSYAVSVIGGVLLK